MSAEHHPQGAPLVPNQNDNGEVPPLHKAARAYATHHVAIFPCQTHGKKPLLPRCPNATNDDGLNLTGQALATHAADCPRDGHGFHDATTNLDTIDRWWTDHPDANIGIALGPNAVFAVDVDGPQGREQLDHLEQTHGPLPETYQVVTGRAEGSGKHHLYQQPDNGPPVGNHRLADHLETRGDGGYIIAPPSIHPSGRPYMAMGRWSDITRPPAWLVAAARPTDTPTVPTAPDTNGADPAALRRLDAACGKVAMAAEGDRNNTLNWAAYRAGQIIGTGHLDLELAADRLMTAALRAGLDPSESQATITSGLSAGRQDPDHTPALQVPDTTSIPTTPAVDTPDGDTWADQIRATARTGADFLTATRGPIPALWGDGTEVLWAEGEGLLVAGPAGVGKTTIVQQVVAGLIGHPDHRQPLGRPLAEPRNVLYLALDRPRQIGRSLGRMIHPDDPSIGRLVIWDQPLPFDPAIHRQALAAMARAVDCQVVVVDSIYDLSPSIVKPEVAGEVIRTLKVCVNEGIDLVGIHHPRKQPTTHKSTRPHLDDLYGGMQLGAGFGSVLYVKGNAGDLEVSLVHLKQPGDVVGPLTIVHDHETGRSSVAEQVDLVALAIAQGAINVQQAAAKITGNPSPTRADKERARRSLDRLVKGGQLTIGRSGVGEVTVYVPGGTTVLEDDDEGMEVPL